MSALPLGWADLHTSHRSSPFTVLPAALRQQHQALALPAAWDLDHCKLLWVLHLGHHILCGAHRGSSFFPSGCHTWALLVRMLPTSWAKCLAWQCLSGSRCLHELPPHVLADAPCPVRPLYSLGVVPVCGRTDECWLNLNKVAGWFWSIVKEFWQFITFITILSKDIMNKKSFAQLSKGFRRDEKKNFGISSINCSYPSHKMCPCSCSLSSSSTLAFKAFWTCMSRPLQVRFLFIPCLVDTLVVMHENLWAPVAVLPVQIRMCVAFLMTTG